jgi:hypothetical protein
MRETIRETAFFLSTTAALIMTLGAIVFMFLADDPTETLRGLTSNRTAIAQQWCDDNPNMCDDIGHKYLMNEEW